MKRGRVNDVNDANASSECFNDVHAHRSAKHTNTLQDDNVANNATNVVCDY